MSAYAGFYILSKDDLPGLRRIIKRRQSERISELGGDLSPPLGKVLLRAMKSVVTVKDPELIRQLRKAFPELKVPKSGGQLEVKRKLVARPPMSASNYASSAASTDAKETAYDYIVEHGAEPWKYRYSGHTFSKTIKESLGAPLKSIKVLWTAPFETRARFITAVDAISDALQTSPKQLYRSQPWANQVLPEFAAQLQYVDGKNGDFEMAYGYVCFQDVHGTYWWARITNPSDLNLAEVHGELQFNNGYQIHTKGWGADLAEHG